MLFQRLLGNDMLCFPFQHPLVPTLLHGLLKPPRLFRFNSGAAVELFRKVKCSGPTDAHIQFLRIPKMIWQRPPPSSIFPCGGGCLVIPSSEFQITGKPSKTNRSMMFDGTCGVKAIVFKCWCYHVISESKKWPHRRCLRAVCVSLFDKLDVRAVSAYILVQRRYDPTFKKKFDPGGILQVLRAR